MQQNPENEERLGTAANAVGLMLLRVPGGYLLQRMKPETKAEMEKMDGVCCREAYCCDLGAVEACLQAELQRKASHRASIRSDSQKIEALVVRAGEVEARREQARRIAAARTKADKLKVAEAGTKTDNQPDKQQRVTAIQLLRSGADLFDARMALGFWRLSRRAGPRMLSKLATEEKVRSALSDSEKDLLADAAANELKCDAILDHHFAELTGLFDGLKVCPHCGLWFHPKDKRQILHVACREARQEGKRLAKKRAENAAHTRENLDRMRSEHRWHRDHHCFNNPCADARTLGDQLAAEKAPMVNTVGDLEAAQEQGYRDRAGLAK